MASCRAGQPVLGFFERGIARTAIRTCVPLEAHFSSGFWPAGRCEPPLWLASAGAASGLCSRGITTAVLAGHTGSHCDAFRSTLFSARGSSLQLSVPLPFPAAVLWLVSVSIVSIGLLHRQLSFAALSRSMPPGLSRSTGTLPLSAHTSLHQ